MAVRIEQNWTWSKKPSLIPLCVVSTQYETTHCRICLTSDKNLHLHWASRSSSFHAVSSIRGFLSMKWFTKDEYLYPVSILI